MAQDPTQKAKLSLKALDLALAVPADLQSAVSPSIRISNPP